MQRRERDREQSHQQRINTQHANFKSKTTKTMATRIKVMNRSTTALLFLSLSIAILFPNQCHILPILVLPSITVAEAAAAGSGYNFNSPSSTRSRDPYEILGVTKDATQEDIKRSYRKLCLKYHPDKNVQSSEREKKKCEEAFKMIQTANSQIGDEDSRRQYDTASSLSMGRSSSSSSSYPNHGMPDGEALFRSFYGSQQFQPRRGHAFYVNGVDVSHLFNPFSSSSPGFGGGNPLSRDSAGPKSIFVQHVTVPLSELYSGVPKKEFVLSDNFIQRYRAAFRGGIVGNLALQGLIT